MNVFLDFEASSLSKHSYPVEIAWIFEDGRSNEFLIRPAPGWTDWSVEAERIHGISRERQQDEGVEIGRVVAEMMDALAGHQLYASAPSWDGKWLSALLRAGGLPRHALRLAKSDTAFFEAARAILGEAWRDDDLKALVTRTIENTEPSKPAHRALADATLELERFKRVAAAAQRLQTASPSRGQELR